MSLEQLKLFIEKVKSDTELQAQVLAAGAQNTVAIEKIAQDAGFSINSEDFANMQAPSNAVSDQELEAAAGGFLGNILPIPSMPSVCLGQSACMLSITEPGWINC